MWKLSYKRTEQGWPASPDVAARSADGTAILAPLSQGPGLAKASAGIVLFAPSPIGQWAKHWVCMLLLNFGIETTHLSGVEWVRKFLFSCFLLHVHEANTEHLRQVTTT